MQRSQGWYLLHTDVTLLAGEVIVLSEEQHAVALLPFPHGNTRAVPVAMVGLQQEGKARQGFITP